ncbi:MAG: hypothetical protein FIB06_09830 [Betaproteobacteria bacterium]|nr:hypothetical protein [Betaproteobacteria bacterium]
MDDNRRLGPYLMLTITMTGALVMVIEIAGARVIAPYFGVGLFVWTALISVTLLALAAGYWIGGVVADRRPEARILYLIIGAAGLYVLFLPWLRDPVVQLCIPLGLRAGTFVSATLLFAPPLALLGAVSPFAIRLGARVIENLGRKVGLFYAISTAGSFCGAMLTGFYLLANVGVGRTLTASGLFLVALSAGYLLFIGRRPALATPLLIAPVLALLTPVAPVEARLADGTVARIVDQKDSFYGSVKVIDYRFGPRGIRELTIDGLVQGGVDLQTGAPIYEYAALLDFLPRHLRPQTDSALVIGLGSGALPRTYAAQGMAVETVDIDPVVVDLCRRHFGLPPGHVVHLEDARTFLNRGGKSWDLIVLDVFSGDTTPGHLLSVEAMGAMKARLAPGGLLAFNLIGSLDAPDSTLPSILATLRAVFAQAVLYPLYKGGESGGNVVVVASDQALAGTPVPAPAGLPQTLADGIAHALANPLPVGDRFARHAVLTDDFNPIDTRDQTVRDGVRNTILQTTPLALLGVR